MFDSSSSMESATGRHPRSDSVSGLCPGRHGRVVVYLYPYLYLYGCDLPVVVGCGYGCRCVDVGLTVMLHCDLS